VGRWALRSGQWFQINAHLRDLKVALSDFIWTATLGVFLYEWVQVRCANSADQEEKEVWRECVRRRQFTLSGGGCVLLHKFFFAAEMIAAAVDECRSGGP